MLRRPRRMPGPDRNQRRRSRSKLARLRLTPKSLNDHCGFGLEPHSGSVLQPRVAAWLPWVETNSFIPTATRLRPLCNQREA
jgi:hypothetical protein